MEILNDGTSRARIPDWPALMTKEQAAAYTSLGVRTIERLRSSGELKAARIGTRALRYRRKDVDEWIEQLPVAHRVNPSRN